MNLATGVRQIFNIHSNEVKLKPRTALTIRTKQWFWNLFVVNIPNLLFKVPLQRKYNRKVFCEPCSVELADLKLGNYYAHNKN